MSDSEEDVPLAQRAVKKTTPAKANGTSSKKATPRKRKAESEASEGEDDESEEASSSSSDEDSGDDSDVPLATRKAKATPKKTAKSPAKKAKKAKTEAKSARKAPGGKSSGQIMWKTLKHCGVLFPPEYQPHGVKMLYDGKPVDLTPDQEEVATMFAIMKETDYMKKPIFLKNFWDGFKEVLGKNHVIKGLDKCDFTPIYEYLMADREKKKNMTKEVGHARHMELHGHWGTHAMVLE